MGLPYSFILLFVNRTEVGLTGKSTAVVASHVPSERFGSSPMVSNCCHLCSELFMTQASYFLILLFIFWYEPTHTINIYCLISFYNTMLRNTNNIRKECMVMPVLFQMNE